MFSNPREDPDSEGIEISLIHSVSEFSFLSSSSFWEGSLVHETKTKRKAVATIMAKSFLIISIPLMIF